MKKSVECKFFPNCGGCDFLDLSDEKYQKLKIDNFKNDLANLFTKDLNLDHKISYKFIGAKSRRKINLQIDFKNNLGFFAKKTKSVVGIDSCYIAEEKISQLILPLRKLIKSQELNLFTQVSITSFDDSLDIIFQVKKDLNFGQTQKIILFAKEHDLNISYKIKNHVTPIYLPKKNKILINFFDDLVDNSRQNHHVIEQNKITNIENNISIDLNGEIFIQATKKGLISIVQLIRNFLKENRNIKKIADIYAGFGAYSFSIADLVSSTAFEGSEEMVNLISKNSSSNSLAHKIKAVKKDLFQDAITKDELNNFNLIIINPPRNGATPQIKEIAKSKIKNVIYVSCNPKTFAFDAEILFDAGFEIKSMLVIDQFYGGKHIELAAILQK